MSFLKISDPAKRDAMVKEYLELKKNIRDNLLSERTGELELQTDLSKFYRPITETQKATAREITEGLKPIREGIEKLPQTIGKAREGEEDEDEYEYDEEEEEDESIGKIASYYLNKPNTDKIFGIRKISGHHYIGNKHVIIKNDNIMISEDGSGFIGTPGLWGLITSKNPDKDKIEWSEDDGKLYVILMKKTNALHHNYNPNNPYPRSSRSAKWNNILKHIWKNEPLKVPYKGYNIPRGWYEREGVVVIPSDPNALLERLDLLLASQDAGHTGVGNELISICDELKRQGVLDTKTYKKINSIIKK